MTGPVQADSGGRLALDRDALRTLTNGDAAFAAELLQAFVVTSPPLVSDLRLALASRDGAQLARATHRLKGALLNVGAVLAATRAAAIEGAAGDDDLLDAARLCAALEQDMNELLAAIAIELGAQQRTPE